jgi:hypothetical protein
MATSTNSTTDVDYQASEMAYAKRRREHDYSCVACHVIELNEQSSPIEESPTKPERRGLFQFNESIANDSKFKGEHAEGSSHLHLEARWVG